MNTIPNVSIQPIMLHDKHGVDLLVLMMHRRVDHMQHKLTWLRGPVVEQPSVVDPSVVRIDLRLVPQLAEQHGSLMHALDGVPVACADVPVECDDAPEACDVQLGAYDDALLGAYDAPAVYGDHELPDLSDIVASPSETEPCHPLPCLHIASSREVSMLSTFLPSLVPSPQT
mmetsp:Transcript_16105/g.23865  ORF Transcript_16105/g.23865 Transcript_16105/m.23865 type:complete len:172 (+) Transcript_16105:184-699(+)|eukprot:15323800-Ditylum_brightwellii.AAC.2